MGKPLRCPFCKSLLQASGLSEAGSIQLTLLRWNPLQSRLMLPGLLLLMIGSTGMVLNGVDAAQAWVDPKGYAERTRSNMQMHAEQLGKEADKTPEKDEARVRRLDRQADLVNHIPIAVKWLPWFKTVTTLLSVLTTIGGVCLVTRRYRRIALTGAIASILNMATCCGFVGLPLGGWALIRILSPEGTKEFQQKPTSPSS